MNRDLKNFILTPLNLLYRFSPKLVLQIIYWLKFKEKLDLKEPKTFNAKLNWLKLYYRNADMAVCADKYAVRGYLERAGYADYLTRLYWCGTDPSAIPYEQLPDSFVIKSTTGSGNNIVVCDKSVLNRNLVAKKTAKWLKEKYLVAYGEWHYAKIKPSIIIEEYLEDGKGLGLTDYKFYCFDGYVDCVMACIDRRGYDAKFYFFDSDWQLKRINEAGQKAPEGFSVPKPKCLDEMFHIAGELSKGWPFVRVDLYECDGKVYFGELTFFPSSGFDTHYLPETDAYFGSLIKLSQNKG